MRRLYAIVVTSMCFPIFSSINVAHFRTAAAISMADHIAFAVKRMENKEQISNPLNDDIRVMFYREYKIAENIRHILKDKKQIDI